MKDSIFNYVLAFSLGVSFTYLSLGYQAQSIVMLVMALICIPLSILFKRKG